MVMGAPQLRRIQAAQKSSMAIQVLRVPSTFNIKPPKTMRQKDLISEGVMRNLIILSIKIFCVPVNVYSIVNGIKKCKTCCAAGRYESWASVPRRFPKSLESRSHR